jgi:sugar/nucleoside kinase (ribokinase family)
VGPDVSHGLLDPLRDAGVDLSGIDFQSPVTTTNQLLYAADGTKELKYLKQAGPITSGDIPEEFRHASAFHICPLDYEISLETVHWLRQSGGIMSVDMGGYGGAHICRATAAQKKLSPSDLRKLIACFDIVKASDEDARLIFAGEGLSDEDAAQRFVAWGAGIGIITQGERGSLVFTKEHRYRVPAIPGNVTDVTGGGDSYIAGFLAEYLKTRDPWQAGLFASSVALCVIEKTGGVSANRMPSVRDARVRVPRELTPQLA